MTELSEVEKKAWEVYCDRTACCLSVKDFWYELSDKQKAWWIKEAASEGHVVCLVAEVDTLRKQLKLAAEIRKTNRRVEKALRSRGQVLENRLEGSR